ncbi:MAG: ATP-binding cassette domain-containing protein, partial [Lachnospiraceae bacterium]|nr:ATP-binding cassette domain-containing protein [Lachnospiraceae bacterium]
KFTRPVLRDISYVFETGKMYVIKGVSGCGKTTLLNVLGGIDNEYEGRVTWEEDKHPAYIEQGLGLKGPVEKDKKTASKAEEACAGYVFQKSLLLDGLTARENLLLIRNDPSQINKISSELGIGDLLDKLPSALSGGERQRVSVARAILNDPLLVLADEPTASLDGDNSDRIAALMAELRRQGRMIIVATHEDCFDSQADVILRLNYGILETEHVLKNDPDPEVQDGCPGDEQGTASEPRFPLQQDDSAGTAVRRRKNTHVYYALKRHPQLFKLKTLLPLAFAFWLLLLAGTVGSCFSREAIRLYARNFPMDLVMMTPEQYRDFDHKDWLSVYDYLTTEDKGVTAYYLMPEQDSVFRVKGMLLCGQFPQKEEEVVLSQKAARILFPERDFAACVGQSFSFCGRSWQVSAIAAEYDAASEENYMADAAYWSVEEAAVFVPYESLRMFAEVQMPPSGYLMAVARGISEDASKRAAVEDAISYHRPLPDEEDQRVFANIYYSVIDEYQKRIDEIMMHVYAIIVLISCLVCFYVISVIR